MVGLVSGDGGLIPALAGGPYGADRLVEGLDYAGALTDALDAAALPWLQFHPAYGPGQFELSLAPGDPLTAADHLVAARLLIQRITRRQGWHANFSPLPDPARVGNGGHLHLSLMRHGRPLLQGGDLTSGLTEAGAGLLGSLVAHLPALLPIACPLEVSYLLVGAMAALVGEGLRHPLPLPPPVAGDPSLLSDPPPRLPGSLAAASDALLACDSLRTAMGEQLHRTFLETLRAEVRRAQALEADALVASTCWLPAALP